MQYVALISLLLKVQVFGSVIFFCLLLYLEGLVEWFLRHFQFNLWMRSCRGSAYIYQNNVGVYLDGIKVFITNFQHFIDVISDRPYKNQFSLSQMF